MVTTQWNFYCLFLGFLILQRTEKKNLYRDKCNEYVICKWKCQKCKWKKNANIQKET